jgi:hypothetical protein
MLKARYILAAIVGALAAAAVWCWPLQPRWRSGPGAGALEHFSPDGTIVVTSSWSRSGKPFVCRWDAASGRLLGRVEFPQVYPGNPHYLHPSPDGRRALFGESPVLDPNDPNFQGGEWRLFDGVSGQQVTGPIPGLTYAALFSRDGRWFWGTAGDPASDSRNEGIDIYSAETGVHILGLHGSRVAERCLFSADGATAAVKVISTQDNGDDAKHTIRIIELPSGLELRRFQLPQRKWIRYDNWDGRYFDAVAKEPLGPHGKPLWFNCRFDSTKEPLGDGVQDPLLQWDEAIDGKTGSWMDSPDCVGSYRAISNRATTLGWPGSTLNSVWCDNLRLGFS